MPFKLYNNWDSLKVTKVTVILNDGNRAIHFYKSLSCFKQAWSKKGTIFPCWYIWCFSVTKKTCQKLIVCNDTFWPFSFWWLHVLNWLCASFYICYYCEKMRNSRNRISLNRNISNYGFVLYLLIYYSSITMLWSLPHGLIVGIFYSLIRNIA